MPIDTKLLTPADGRLLANVAADVFDDPVDARAAAEFLNDPRHHIAVAIDNGVVVGFASAVHYVHPDKPAPEMWINEVGVAASHRGLGAGKAILAVLLDRARELGCVEAWVLTGRDNLAAMRLYAAAEGVQAPADSVMFTFYLQ